MAASPAASDHRAAAASTAAERKEHLYAWLTGIFVAALIVGDLIGGKFFRVWTIDLSVGMISFPLTFVLTDVVNEFYGAKGARRITFVGLGTALFAFLVINISLALPASPKGMSAELFRTVFGWSNRLYVASITAYLIGQLADITVFELFRRLTRHRLLWLRATGSTVVSQAIDTIVVNFVLLSGKEPSSGILRIIFHSYVTKIVIAVGLTPIIYAVHGVVLRLFHVPEEPELPPLA